MSKIETLTWAEVEWWIARSGDEALVGARLRQWREAREPKMSLDKMAADFTAFVVARGRPSYQISKATLVRLEAGQRKLTSTEAVLLAQFFDKTLPELLLPASDASDIEDLRLFDEASVLLAHVREAMHAYVLAQERLRERVINKPALRALIGEREREATSQRDGVALDIRKRVARTAEILSARGEAAPAVPTEREWIAQSEPTIEQVVAHHALGNESLSDDGWHREYTWDGERATADWQARSQTSTRRPQRTEGRIK